MTRQSRSAIPLRDLQTWMRWAITDPRGVSDALADPNPEVVEYSKRYQSPAVSAYAFIATSGDLSVESRLSVYAEAYFSRLLEALEADFKRLRFAMTELDFQLLISEYLKAHPSTTFNISEVGRHLPEFVKAKHPDSCLPEIAVLEIKAIETFYSADAPPLNLDVLNSLSDEGWANLKLETDPSVQLLTSFWPLEEFWNLEEEKDQSAFEKGKTERCFLLWRKHFHVEFKEITRLELEALGLIKNGSSLSATLDAIGERFIDLAEPEALSEQVMSFFSRWISDGIISKLVI
jgi:hypothetical protein